jgi:hypothetical protein
MYTHTHIQTHLNTFSHTCPFYLSLSYTHKASLTPVLTHLLTNTHTHTHTHTHRSVPLLQQSNHVLHTRGVGSSCVQDGGKVCGRVCVCVYIYIGLHVQKLFFFFVFTYARTHTYTHIHTHRINVPEAAYGHPSAQESQMIRHISDLAREGLLETTKWPEYMLKTTMASFFSVCVCVCVCVYVRK